MTDLPEFIKRINIARAAIVTELKHRALSGDPEVRAADRRDLSHWFRPQDQDNCYSGSGIMVCPICKTGMLKYSRAKYNGHVHAQCLTPGCVSWME